MIVKLLTEHHLEFLSLKEAAEAHPSLHLSNCKLLKISCHGSNLNQSILEILIQIILASFYTPPLKCGEVLCYTLRCLSVCPSVRPSTPFPIDNLSIYSQNFFKFCIHIVIGDEWYGIVNGQNPSIFNRVTALFRIGKMVSGLLFLYYS